MRRRPNSFWPIVLSWPLGLLAVIVAHEALLLPQYYTEALADNPSFRFAFQTEGVHGLVSFLVAAFWVGAALFFVGSVIALLWHKRWTLALLRKCYIAAYVLGGLYLCITSKIIWHIVDYKVPVRGVVTDSMTGFFWWYQLLWPVLIAIGLVALLHLWSWRRRAINQFTGSEETRPALGDLVLENIRTHGRQPVFRKCLFSSVGIHVLVIVILPLALSVRGCVQPYRVPKGSGTPTGGGSPTATGAAQTEAQKMAQVKIVKAMSKKSRKRRIMVNPRSAISFHVPDLDESGVEKVVDTDTQLTYKADPTRVLMAAGADGPRGVGGHGTGGGLGAGGGTTGGWPDGMDNAMVRFIRLQYDGAEWDMGMDPITRGDINFLEAFHRETGFKVASAGESNSISQLHQYPKGMAPPFVFMTGSGDINVTAGDMRVLREYLLGGGLLFTSCGSPLFDQRFRAFIQQVLPGNPLVVIADDDPIFQMPFVFPNGAPPLWHHGGTRVLGVKVNDRWVVFYHPGDIVDAWKNGHEGLDPKLVQEAYEVGINVMYYAFTHYLELTRQDRK